MSEIVFSLPELYVGARCFECPAVSVCPAIGLKSEIDDLNSDLKVEGLADLVIARVQGEVFSYGIGKFTEKIKEVQGSVKNCLGAVALDNGQYIYPSFKDTTTDKIVADDAEDLKDWGFVVETRIKDGQEIVSSVVDPSAKIEHIDIGHKNGGGIREKVRSFRKAASFKGKND